MGVTFNNRLPKKKSARLLIACHELIKKEIQFELWLAVHHNYLFDPDHLLYLNKKQEKIKARIKKASNREHPIKKKGQQLSIA